MFVLHICPDCSTLICGLVYRNEQIDRLSIWSLYSEYKAHLHPALYAGLGYTRKTREQRRDPRAEVDLWAGVCSECAQTIRPERADGNFECKRNICVQKGEMWTQACDFLIQADILKESRRNSNASTKCEHEEKKSEHAKELCHWKGMKSCSQTENLCSWLMTWFYFHIWGHVKVLQGLIAEHLSVLNLASLKLHSEKTPDSSFCVWIKLQDATRTFLSSQRWILLLSETLFDILSQKENKIQLSLSGYCVCCCFSENGVPWPSLSFCCCMTETMPCL